MSMIVPSHRIPKAVGSLGPEVGGWVLGLDNTLYIDHAGTPYIPLRTQLQEWSPNLGVKSHGYNTVSWVYNNKENKYEIVMYWLWEKSKALNTKFRVGSQDVAVGRDAWIPAFKYTEHFTDGQPLFFNEPGGEPVQGPPASKKSPTTTGGSSETYFRASRY